MWHVCFSWASCSFSAYPVQAEAANPCLPCPCLAGVFMALVVCIVPVRKGEVKEAEAQPELEHLGEWIQGCDWPGPTYWAWDDIVRLQPSRSGRASHGEKMGLRVFADGNPPDCIPLFGAFLGSSRQLQWCERFPCRAWNCHLPLDP